MRVLICTQVVDRSHSDLGFFHAWLEEFSKRCDQVTVVCLYEGVHSFPSNVRVLSLGKEKGVSRGTYIFRFFSYVFGQRHEYDVVLVHMNTEYILLGGLLWRLLRKPIGLWYVHKYVGWRLKVAAHLTNYIFTVSPESFRLKNSKVHILGHGIDTSIYVRPNDRPGMSLERKRILMLGRTSPSKRIDIGLDLLAFLREEKEDCELVIVGEPMGKTDEEYLLALQRRVEESGLGDRISFAGAVAHTDTAKHYWNAHVFLHTSETGSVDKVVLEALAAGLPVVSSSEAFRSTPGVVWVQPGDIAHMADAVRKSTHVPVSSVGVEYVRTGHSLPVLVTRILSILSTGHLPK